MLRYVHFLPLPIASQSHLMLWKCAFSVEASTRFGDRGLYPPTLKKKNLNAS